jgi:hypothetical protein
MAIDWSMARQPNVLGMMLQGYEQGQELKKQERSRAALGQIMGTPTMGEPSMGQSQPMASSGAQFNDLMPDDMRTAMAFQGQQQQQQAAQAKAQQDQLIQMGRLLNNATDEATYQQSIAAARQIGIDTSRAPANFDPNWVGQQKTILSAFEKDGGQQISGLARELSDAGYKPGTPEFQQAMTTALQGKYAPQYTDQQGNLRQGTLPALPQMQKPQIIPTRPAGMSDDDLFRQAQEAVANGADRNTVFEQLQAWGVKP